MSSAPAHRARRVGRGSMTVDEDRHHRPPEERQDHAVQPPDRIQRGDLLLRWSARRAARRRRARARRAGRSAERAVHAEEDHLRGLRGRRSGGQRAGRPAGGARRGLDAKDLRNADALVHVVRAFPDAAGAPADPRRDVADLETELILADLEVVERRLERLEASLKKKRTDVEVKEQAILLKVKPALESETPIRAMELAEDESRALR